MSTCVFRPVQADQILRAAYLPGLNSCHQRGVFPRRWSHFRTQVDTKTKRRRICNRVYSVVLILSPARTRRMSTSTSIIHTHRRSLIADMSFNTRIMGQALSSDGADVAALRLYDVYRGRKEKSLFSDMLFAEIMSDNIEDELLNYSRWCSSTPIPTFFGENLQARSGKNHQDGPVRLLVLTTLSKYIGKFISQIIRKFPQHPDFVDLCADEVPQWWTKLRPLFGMQCIRFHFLLGSDFTFGETAVCLLYQDNGNENSGELIVNDYVSAINH